MRTCGESSARVAWVRPWLGEAERTPTPHVSAGGPWEAAPTRTAPAKRAENLACHGEHHYRMRDKGRRAATGTYISRFPGAPPALPNILGTGFAHCERAAATTRIAGRHVLDNHQVNFLAAAITAALGGDARGVF